MRKGFSLLLLVVLFGTVLHADEDFTILLPDDTSLVVRVRPTQTFVEYDRPSVWRIANDVRRVGEIGTLANSLDIKLQFDVGSLCAKKPGQWSSIYEDRLRGSLPSHGEFDLEESVGCTIEIVKVDLISAVNGTKIIVNNHVPSIDLTDQLKVIQSKRDAELTRRKRLAAERDARYAKAKSEEQAKAASERARIRAACSTIYKNTSDKKVADLLVKEEQQVRACQALGLYPPQ